VDIVTWKDEDLKKLRRGGMGGSPSLYFDVAEEENIEVGFIVVAENGDICDEALKALDVEWRCCPLSWTSKKEETLTPGNPARG